MANKSPRSKPYKPSFEVNNTHSPRLDSLYYHSTYKSSLEKFSEYKPEPPLEDLSKLEQKSLSSHEKIKLVIKDKRIMVQVDGKLDEKSKIYPSKLTTLKIEKGVAPSGTLQDHIHRWKYHFTFSCFYFLFFFLSLFFFSSIEDNVIFKFRGGE